MLCSNRGSCSEQSAGAVKQHLLSIADQLPCPRRRISLLHRQRDATECRPAAQDRPSTPRFDSCSAGCVACWGHTARTETRV